MGLVKNGLANFLLALSATLFGTTASAAADLEVTHWWTSGGESAAVKVFADAFNNSGQGDVWVDGAIAGSGAIARPIIVSRILGGDPMGATQLNSGRQAEELMAAGLMLDLTDVALAEGWIDLIYPPSLLESCTYEGKIYCVPVNIHSPQWLWLSNQAFADAGVTVPTNWAEFVAASPALRADGKLPLALGQQPWQAQLAFDNISLAVGGVDLWLRINRGHDPEAAASAEMTEVFEAVAQARGLTKGSHVTDWNQATNMVITGAAGGQLMGDWAQGEFQVAGKAAGVDYTCLPGLGVNEILTTGGDSFYFPVNADPEITSAQKRLASLMLSREVQVAFNLKKGSLPVRGDIDLSAANDCMKRGLDILENGITLPGTNQLHTPDTQTQLQDLMNQFLNSSDMSVAEAQATFVKIIASAD